MEWKRRSSGVEHEGQNRDKKEEDATGLIGDCGGVAEAALAKLDSFLAAVEGLRSVTIRQLCREGRVGYAATEPADIVHFVPT